MFCAAAASPHEREYTDGSHDFNVLTATFTETGRGAVPEMGCPPKNPLAPGPPRMPAAPIAAAVRGPTCPNPVVSGAPEDAIPFFACQRWTAPTVSDP